MEYRKKIKALISGILADDTQKINSIVQELSESIIPEKEDQIMQVLTESFKGDKNV